jgi:hypothetical protein
MSAVSVGQRFGAWVVALVGPDRQARHRRVPVQNRRPGCAENGSSLSGESKGCGCRLDPPPAA